MKPSPTNPAPASDKAAAAKPAYTPPQALRLAGKIHRLCAAYPPDAVRTAINFVSDEYADQPAPEQADPNV